MYLNEFKVGPIRGIETRKEATAEVEVIPEADRFKCNYNLPFFFCYICTKIQIEKHLNSFQNKLEPRPRRYYGSNGAIDQTIYKYKHKPLEFFT